jgi:hypothetical protein
MKERKENCDWCDEPVLAGEQHQGFRTPMHFECGMRQATGSVGHILGRCSCFHGPTRWEDPPKMTRREGARAAFALWMQIRSWYGDWVI